jgi:hypothetical protein
MCNCGRRQAGVVARPIRTRGPYGRRGVAIQPVPEPALFNGMVIRDTREWGPLLWTVMHSLAEVGALAAIADSDWTDLFVSLQTSLPCPDCTNHYTAWLAARPPPTTGTTASRLWLLDLHNDINQRKGVAVWTEAQLTPAYGSANKTTLTTQVEGLRALIGVGAVTVLARMVAAL